ncbi:hypothetical protein CPT34_30610 [Rhizobium sophoriradicis]|uniref:Uncharacterized protein n=2 Tax=Rhizobium TaxID=379 RepID=B3Q2M3_RHIE6|nr:hypothetical protein RHECIAT_PB0000218 [Rhizobium etli CIAT 652]AJC82362.1 hypothetical protein IE4803_PB00309 [Rhizobium etli bv. phaseoli str. IE4803]ARM15062.1 hypothetical protein Bra5_PB00316 [Rhizobium phaseoli Brasil 5]ARQ60753.1 hypothetical protein Kim5_PA00283 [Rhizobium sp. Kim5]PCK77325.1 hypothetical protein CPT34_30610 [Rhizobium sophoriradicis]PDT31090.1 hypothetical protein CO671_31220 [Rhizobium sp. M10]
MRQRANLGEHRYMRSIRISSRLSPYMPRAAVRRSAGDIMPLKCSSRSTTDAGSLHARWTRRLAARSMRVRAPTPPRAIAEDAIHLMQQLARRRPREDFVVGGLQAHVCNGTPQVALCNDCPTMSIQSG